MFVYEDFGPGRFFVFFRSNKFKSDIFKQKMGHKKYKPRHIKCMINVQNLHEFIWSNFIAIIFCTKNESEWTKTITE